MRVSSDENAPRKQRGDFKKSNLIEIARAVSDEKRKTSSDAEVSTEATAEKMRPPSIHNLFL